MSSINALDALRERNKDLFFRLKQLRQEVESLNGRKREREREDEAEAEEMLTLTGGDRGTARAALTRPTVRFADTGERKTGVQETIITPSLIQKNRTTERTENTEDNLQHSTTTRPFRAKSCLVNQSTEQREVRSRVTFQPDECEEISASDRHHVQPLLGYDWIAGVLDTEDSLIERSDEFFDDLRAFRSLNKEECVHGPQAEFSKENHSVLPLLQDKSSPQADMDAHQCTFSYRINSRLFPVPLHAEERCPVCKKHKSSHPHTAADPALIRVSIPRSTLLPPYKYKAHRRCSFDPSDSLGLPSHCLSGWSNTGLSSLSPPSCLDLRSSLNTKSSTWLQNKDLEDLSTFSVSRNQHSDVIPQVSRLARHNFQHTSPRRKLGSRSYPVC